MQRSARMNAVFLTNFSDSCFRAIPAVAQMADELAVDLTLLHSYHPEERTKAEAEATLSSFFPEADRYPGTRRLCVQEDLVPALHRLDNAESIDLIFAPAADNLGLPRIGHRSLRRQLIKEIGVPIWTIGRSANSTVAPTRNVAYWWNPIPEHNTALPQAAEYAWKIGATLHILYGFPDYQDGAIAPLGGNFSPDEILKCVDRYQPTVPVPLRVHVGHGEGKRGLRELIAKSRADVLIRPSQEGLLDRILPWRDISQYLPCPVIYVGQASAQRQWAWTVRPAATLRPVAVRQALAEPHSR